MDHNDMYTAFGESLVKSLVTTDRSQSSSDQVNRINDAVVEAVAFARGHLGTLYDLSSDTAYWDGSLRRAICNRAMFSLALTRPSRDMHINAKAYKDLSDEVFVDIRKGNLKLDMVANFNTGAQIVGDDITDGVWTGSETLELLGFEWSWADYCVW